MQIDTLMYNPGADGHYTDALRNVFEDHMTYLRTNQNTSVLLVDEHERYKFEGDLYGLFAIMGIPAQYHWIIMRVNNMDSRLVIPVDLITVMLPPYDIIDKIRYANGTTNSVK